MKFKEFIKPTIWKTLFTVFMVLIGGILIGAILNLGWNGKFFNTLLNMLFSNFYYSAKALCFAVCARYPGDTCGGLDMTCFWTYAIEILVIQIISYYLIACLAGLLFRRKKI